MDKFFKSEFRKLSILSIQSILGKECSNFRIYSVTPCFDTILDGDLPEKKPIAVCGGPYCLVFSLEVGDNASSKGGVQAETLFQASQESDQDFYSVTWLRLGQKLFLALAGNGQSIYVVDWETQKPVVEFMAHGKAVFHLATHPTRRSVFVSCSEDLSIRAWRLFSKEDRVYVLPLYIFAGLTSHTGPVLSLVGSTIAYF